VSSAFFFPLFTSILLTTGFVGKTNQHGRREYGAALRHRDYRLCLVGALAVYFFYRWHLSGEPAPYFRTSLDWYETKVLKRDNTALGARLSDSTASSWTRRLYDECGIKGSKLTHSRPSAAKNAEKAGMTKDQVGSSSLPYN